MVVENNASPKSDTVAWPIKNGFPEATKLLVNTINFNKRMFTFNPYSEVERMKGIRIYDGRCTAHQIRSSLLPHSYSNRLITSLSTNINTSDDCADSLLDTTHCAPIEGETC